MIHFQCSDGYQTNQSTTSQCVNSTWYPETLEIVCSRNTPESKHSELYIDVSSGDHCRKVYSPNGN